MVVAGGRCLIDHDSPLEWDRSEHHGWSVRCTRRRIPPMRVTFVTVPDDLPAALLALLASVRTLLAQTQSD